MCVFLKGLFLAVHQATGGWGFRPTSPTVDPTCQAQEEWPGALRKFLDALRRRHEELVRLLQKERKWFGFSF